MRRFASALCVLLLVALAASACGGSAAPGSGQGAPASATNTPTPRPGPTRRPTATPVPGGPMSGKRTLANGVWMCPQNTGGARYVGNIQEKEYHKLDCSTAEQIPVQERVCFLDHQVAVKFGYAPAKDCSPP
jgi:hypothetical protein